MGWPGTERGHGHFKELGQVSGKQRDFRAFSSSPLLNYSRCNLIFMLKTRAQKMIGLQALIKKFMFLVVWGCVCVCVGVYTLELLEI